MTKIEDDRRSQSFERRRSTDEGETTNELIEKTYSQRELHFNLLETHKQKLYELISTLEKTAKLCEESAKLREESVNATLALNQMHSSVLVDSVIHAINLNNDMMSNSMVLHQQAHYDKLTGLANRTLLKSRLSTSMNSNNLNTAIMFIDLDGFKSVNDEFGHEIGDNLLQVVSKRLTNCVRDSDTVCRYGGDEFVILITSHEGTKHLTRLAKSVLENMSAEFRINEFRINIGASIGISTIGNVDEIIENADIAMYISKKTGKNKFTFFKKT